MDKKYVDWLLESDNVTARIWAATCRLDLDVSIVDSDWRVRAEVARQGFGLERLIQDESPEVRAAVAEQGYELEMLLEDENEDVREAARMQMGGGNRRQDGMISTLESVLSDVLRPKNDTTFHHDNEAPFELLWHAIVLFILCMHPSEKTFDNALRLFYCEVGDVLCFNVGWREYWRVHEGPEVPCPYGSGSDSHTPLEIMFDVWDENAPCYIAVKFYRAYREMLREQYVSLFRTDWLRHEYLERSNDDLMVSD